MQALQDKATMSKRRFTQEEDERIRELVDRWGFGKWKEIAKELNDRTSRQVRERWNHYLSPQLRNTDWTPEEDQLLLSQVSKVGHCWKALEPFFPGRTHIGIKNHYSTITRIPKRSGNKVAVLTLPQIDMGNPGKPTESKMATVVNDMQANQENTEFNFDIFGLSQNYDDVDDHQYEWSVFAM